MEEQRLLVYKSSGYLCGRAATAYVEDQQRLLWKTSGRLFDSSEIRTKLYVEEQQLLVWMISGYFCGRAVKSSDCLC